MLMFGKKKHIGSFNAEYEVAGVKETLVEELSSTKYSTYQELNDVVDKIMERNFKGKSIGKKRKKKGKDNGSYKPVVDNIISCFDKNVTFVKSTYKCLERQNTLDAAKQKKK